MSSSVTGVAQAGSGSASPWRLRALGLVGDLGRLGAVVARVRHEVLEDHLLEVAVLGVHRRPAPRAPATRSSGVSPMPTRIPLVNGIRSSPAARIVSSRRSGCLVGDPWCTTRSGFTDSSISPCEAVTSRSRASSSREQHAHVGVRQHPALERALARPGHVRDEVLVAVLGEPRGHLGVDLGLLAGEHEQLLDAAPRRRRRAAARPRRARTGAPGASRTRSTCSSTGTCATATA